MLNPEIQRYLTMTSFDWGVIAFILVLWTLLQYAGKTPNLRSVKDLLISLDSKGGNIFILAVLSCFFFVHALRLFYHLLSAIMSKTLTSENAFALMGLQFVTSSAFGGAFGALLKTMSGTASLEARGQDERTRSGESGEVKNTKEKKE